MLISKNYFLHQSAKEAFKNYVRAYLYHLKQIFDIETLDLTKVAKSFRFTVPPAVDLIVEISKTSRKSLGGGGFQKHKRPKFGKVAETHDLSPDRQTWAGQSTIQQITVIYAHFIGVDDRQWCSMDN